MVAVYIAFSHTMDVMETIVAKKGTNESQSNETISQAENHPMILCIGFHESIGDLESLGQNKGIIFTFFSSFTEFEKENNSLAEFQAVITDSRNLTSQTHPDWELFRKQIGPYPIWVHISDDIRPAVIVEMMRNGVDEFIPAHDSLSWLGEFFEKLNDHYAMRYKELLRAEHEASMLRKRVEWSSYKDGLRKAWNDVSGREAIINLQTSLSQGAGFGLMLTLMEILGMSDISSGQISIDQELFNKIKTNAQYTRRMLEGLAEYVNVFDGAFKLDRISVEQIEYNIKERIQQFQNLYSKKNMKLRIMDTCSRRTVDANIQLVMLVFDELVINAWKYSRRNTDVVLLTSIRNGYYTLTLQSFPSYQENLAMDTESLEKLKLPFYRIHPPVEDAVEMECFVMGLGLPAVDQIASKMRSIFMLEGGIDYCGTTAEECFLAYFMIPLA